jgi:hypothetical protein
VSQAFRPLRVLWVATKAPWPAVDGGRLLQLLTLQELAKRRGEVEVDLVAPLGDGPTEGIDRALAALCRYDLVEARPRPLPVAVPLALLRGLPVTAVRHSLAAVRRRVRSSARTPAFDVVHAEQVQAMPQALCGEAPVVLRAQNVESELWRTGARGIGSWVAHREAARLARWEGEMVRRAALCFALSEGDAARLGELSGADVRVLPPPCPAELPAGPEVAGEPAVALLVGSGWRPNREGAERFLAEGWPAVRRELPGAALHVFGEASGGGDGVAGHPAPRSADTAFPSGALLVVPLWAGSGVRMKVLEAWARGLPVVATPLAAAGLAATPGRELLVAETPAELAAALVRLARDSDLRRDLVAAGRRLLEARHHPGRVATALLAGWRAVSEAPPPPPWDGRERRLRPRPGA